jgi:hypothetical protein
MATFNAKMPFEDGLNRETECSAEYERHDELRNDLDRKNRFIARNDEPTLSDSFTDDDKSELSVGPNEYFKPGVD